MKNLCDEHFHFEAELGYFSLRTVIEFTKSRYFSDRIISYIYINREFAMKNESENSIRCMKLATVVPGQ